MCKENFPTTVKKYKGKSRGFERKSFGKRAFSPCGRRAIERVSDSNRLYLNFCIDTSNNHLYIKLYNKGDAL
jgi:hypothetical protein